MRFSASSYILGVLKGRLETGSSRQPRLKGLLKEEVHGFLRDGRLIKANVVSSAMQELRRRARRYHFAVLDLLDSP